MARELLTAIPGFPFTAPMTKPPAIPPIAALTESDFPLAASAEHSAAAKAAPAADIQKAGRAIARMMAFESEGPAFPMNRPAVWMGSGYHASWHAAKKVPAAAPTTCEKKG